VRLFSAGAARRQGEDAALLLALVRIGVWGNSENIEKLTRALEG
jgi:hypothetical protein